MKRVTLIDHLQTIFFDLGIFENSTIYIQDVIIQKVKKIELGKLDGALNAFKELEKYIHPRYTKVILDCGSSLNQFMLNLIDEKHNHYIEKCQELGMFEDQMLEMVEVEIFRPYRKYKNDFWNEMSHDKGESK